MDSYKASKAWHVAHELAIAVHELVQQFPAHRDAKRLSIHLRRTSSTTPLQLAKSVEHDTLADKLRSYEIARQAAIDVQEYLSLSRDFRYIEQQTFELLAGRAIMAQRLLTDLIRSTRQAAQTTD